ncbi:hypothetical protein P378_00665 [Desulforamulus profundi]|uniref:Uncharacterized protein n=1 Tax=Desulforamulus profundi TaxID=1383067 RepID=A0A2C6MJ71_9FIRM|nr:hypothetical protein P378_00665 [Desulforamulus profundi]
MVFVINYTPLFTEFLFLEIIFLKKYLCRYSLGVKPSAIILQPLIKKLTAEG